MKQIILILVLVIALFTSGCAFTQANLNISYDQEKARKGPLSAIKPLNFEIVEFSDKRPEVDKIGYKRNGFGQNTANIITTRSVPQIVRDAFVSEFSKNGHIVGGGKDVVLSGTITSFWFDYQMNFFTVEFMGTVRVDLSVTNGKTGTVLLSRTYQGHYNEKSMGGLDETWERVMNTALANMMEDVRADVQLVRVLQAL